MFIGIVIDGKCGQAPTSHARGHEAQAVATGERIAAKSRQALESLFRRTLLAIARPGTTGFEASLTPPPEYHPTAIGIRRIKVVAVGLLETLKAETLRVDQWREKEATRDSGQSGQCVDALPRAAS